MPKETSKYKPEYDKQAEVACKLGATDANLAELFGVSITTIQNWKLNHKTFFDTVKNAKDFYDTEGVENALLKRAKGFEYKEVKTVLDANGKAIPDQTQVTQKQALPDTGACAFWLKNRNPARWRDKQEQVITDDRSDIDLSKLSDDELKQFKELIEKCNKE